MKCESCKIAPPSIKQPSTGKKLCKKCFIRDFEENVHNLIVSDNIFPSKGEHVAIGVSGGKDSTVLLHVLHTLNERYSYGLNLHMVAVDEGISGYRDESLDCVKYNQKKYSLPLVIVSFKDLFSSSLDSIVSRGGDVVRTQSCTYCGILRRRALEEGTKRAGCSVIATGHNADDVAETVLMNFMRGDVKRLARCSNSRTGTSEVSRDEDDDDIEDGGCGKCPARKSEQQQKSVSLATIPRVKPFKTSYQKEIVLYAHFSGLKYFSTECPYAVTAFRGYARVALQRIQRFRSPCVLDTIHGMDTIASAAAITPDRAERGKKSKKKSMPSSVPCVFCGARCTNGVCQTCVIAECVKRENYDVKAVRKQLEKECIV
ncbi:Cytoplasmic tRNA 2-thiolation protein 1 [Aduncisulcus paluster]|uniref:Cytoplasmic tRNA 2-thiolation protein 1 n=1 Tax=Aduncisulcus paluster TaxID=2918883 RepID=A0ABQ5KTC6_9EUKA|nr:Cytoplasmic tRNA 2-thiolation protein 1 [Aduncisulcus paluster]